MAIDAKRIVHLPGMNDSLGSNLERINQMNKILTFVLDTIEPEIGPAVAAFTEALEEAGHIVKEIRQRTDTGEIKLKLPTVVTDVVDNVDTAVTDAEAEFDKLTDEEQAEILKDEEAAAAMSGKSTTGADVTSGSSPNPVGSIPTFQSNPPSSPSNTIPPAS